MMQLHHNATPGDRPRVDKWGNRHRTSPRVHGSREQISHASLMQCLCFELKPTSHFTAGATRYALCSNSKPGTHVRRCNDHKPGGRGSTTIYFKEEDMRQTISIRALAVSVA